MIRRALRLAGFVAGVVLSLVLLVGALTLLVVRHPLAGPPPAERIDPLVIRNVRIVDVEQGRVRAGEQVVVRGGRITAIGPDAGGVGPGILDAGGGFLIPGLFDMHMHSTRFSPALFHPLFVAAGVTSVRDMGGCLGETDSVLACAPDKRRWTEEVASGRRVGPRYVQVTSLPIDGGKRIPPGFDVALGAPDAAGARGRVMHDAARGIDFLKPYNGLGREAYFALAESAAEAGLFLAGHVPLRVSALEAVQAGQRSIEHARVFLWDCHPEIDALRAEERFSDLHGADFRSRTVTEHDAERCAALMDAMRAAGVAYVPTHTTRKLDAFASDVTYLSDPRLRYVPPIVRIGWRSDARSHASSAADVESYRAFYRFGLTLTGRAHRAGVLVLAGSDAPDSYAFPGFGLHDELAHLVEAGLSPLDALRAATRAPAAFVGREGVAGAIRVGADADLVLLRANPLEDIEAVRTVEAVVLAGALYGRADLDRLLAGVEAEVDDWRLWLRYGWAALRSPLLRP